MTTNKINRGVMGVTAYGNGSQLACVDMNRRIAQIIAVSLGLSSGVASTFAGTLTRLDTSGDSGSAPTTAASTSQPLAWHPPKSAPADHPVALSVNLPLMWGTSIGVSAVFAVADHHAVRFNGSRYDKLFLSWITSEDSAPTGRNYDGSVSWIYYPRKVFTGATVEVGALYRDRAEEYFYSMGRNDNYDIESRILAGQAFVGWNWRVGSVFYVATAVGASVGYEKGTNAFRDNNGQDVTENVAESHVGAEGYLRFGAVLD